MRQLFVLLPLCCTAHVLAQQTPLVLPEVTITGRPVPKPVDILPGAVGRVTSVNLDDQATPPRGLDQLLVDEGAAAWDAANSLGIANGLSVRGFVVANQGVSTLQVGRNFLNGHADLVWRFARDPATVQRVDLVSGSDATLLGAGSPAASVLYTSKSPEGAEGQKIGFNTGQQRP
jgi:outer membrane receptor protein involved in Fe transport